MTIFRVQHNSNYTVINNFICKDNRISWKAKGIWLYAFSKKDDWKFYLSDLINQSTDKKDSVSAGLKELEKFGYLKRVRERNEKGELGKAIWTFFEIPQLTDIPEPKAENPILDNPILGNPPLVNTDILVSTNTTNPTTLKKEKVGGLSENKEIYECLKRLEISQQDKVRLTRKYPEQLVQKAIKYANRPDFTPDSLDSYLFHICENPGQIKELKEDKARKKQEDQQVKIDNIIARKKGAEHIAKVLWNECKSKGVRIFVSTDYVEISNDRISEKIHYSEKTFRNQIQGFLRKLELTIPDFINQIP